MSSSASPKPALVVLAAGMGSRYGGLKQIDPVGPSGEAILDYSVYDALRAGFSRVVFVIRRDIEDAFRQSIGSRFERRIAVDYAFQELDDLPAGFTVPEGRTKPWGTAHAILAARNAVQSPFAVINADDFYGAEGYRALAAHLTSGTTDHAMVGFVLRNTLSEFGSVARGICSVSPEFFLRTVTETFGIAPEGSAVRSVAPDGAITWLTGDEIASMNMWGFQPAVFADLSAYFSDFLTARSTDPKAECYLPAAVTAAIAAGRARVRVLASNDEWFGVTYREDRPRVIQSLRDLIAAGSYPEKLWA
ncbi:MAG: NTP transferase domain-containing protein [Terracidiphilus sp.]|nr:NTP transferase domain-containing protein [Terracidiphilus sp.]